MTLAKSVFLMSAVFFLVMPQISSAKELQVGVSPLHIDMGELLAGTQNYASFSLVTQSADEFLVGLAALPGNPDFFLRPQYASLQNTSSEEDASGWVSFPANPVVIRPANGSQQASGIISGWRTAGFAVRIPRDAEPCYHSFQIKPTPYVAASYDTGVNIVAITVITVLFKVPGDCVREGVILDIQQGQGRNGKIGIDTYFRNTGNATISAGVSELKIYSENGTELGKSASITEILKPEQTAVLPAYFDAAMLSPDETYNVTSTVSYGTGSVAKSTFLTLEYGMPTPALWAPAEIAWRAYMPGKTVLLIILIIIVSYLIYRRR